MKASAKRGKTDARSTRLARSLTVDVDSHVREELRAPVERAVQVDEQRLRDLAVAPHLRLTCARDVVRRRAK